MLKLLRVRIILFLFTLFTSIVTHAQTTPLQLPLWEQGAPGFENRRNEPEQAKDYWVKNINNPSIAVYLPPKEKATGAAVVVCPGGGFRLLVYNGEGVAPAQFLNSLGVAAIVLKYRLPREEGSPYSLEKQPREDGQRAIRLVRSHVKEWGLDTTRIGMLGFSAGGEVVAMTTYAPPYASNPKDVIDKLSGRPDFQMLVYPGPLGVPDSIPAGSPPAFAVVANNDSCCSETVVRLLHGYRAAKLPIEVHVFAQGNHAFNMGTRSKLKSIQDWPQRMADWMSDNNILHPAPAGWKPE